MTKLSIAALSPRLLGFAAFLIQFWGVNAQFQAQSCEGCSKRGIDMPISLATGTVRTSEFTAKNKYYNIDIDVRWLLPTEELKCRMGFAVAPLDPPPCKWSPQIELRWKVFDGDQAVFEGTDKGWSSHFEADSDALTRNIGSFKATARHKYVVELTFTQDASALDQTHPRLMVEPPGFSM